MWWFCRPLPLLVVVLDHHNAACGASSTASTGPGETQLLWCSSDAAALDRQGFLPDSLSYAAETVQSVGLGMRERMQLGLMPLERCRTRMISLVGDSLFGTGQQSSGWDGERELLHAPPAARQVERNEGGSRNTVPRHKPRARSRSAEPAQNIEAGEADAVEGPATALGRGVTSFRNRFGSTLEGMRGIVETVGGYPEGKQINPEVAAERLRRTLEGNQRELRRHLKKGNKLLASWAAQAYSEERRIEAMLRAMQERHLLLLSEVKTNAEARLHRAALEAQIEGVRKEWSERQGVLKSELQKRQHMIADKMLSVTRDSKILAKLYGDLMVTRKPSGLETSVLNEENFHRALELIVEDAEEGGWEQVVRSRNGTPSVQRKFMGRDSKGSKFACIRARCTMDAPADAIAELFESSERVKEYNKWFKEGRDLEVLDNETKVVWASSPAALPFVKPRDFVTVVHVRRLSDGSIVVINRGYRHRDAPPSQEYVRGEIILAANVIRPDSRNKNRTHFTMLTQVDPGGIAPAWIINKISARDPVDFLQRVEAAAGGRPKPTRRRSSAAVPRNDAGQRQQHQQEEQEQEQEKQQQQQQQQQSGGRKRRKDSVAA